MHEQVMGAHNLPLVRYVSSASDPPDSTAISPTEEVVVVDPESKVVSHVDHTGTHNVVGSTRPCAVGSSTRRFINQAASRLGE